MTTHEILVAARNLIDREGWGHPGDWGANKSCVVQATYVAGRYARGDQAADTALVAALGLPHVEALVDWNDAQDRTVEQVLAAFDAAIAATAPPPPDLDLSELVEATA